MSARVTKITMLVDTAQGQANVAELNASLSGNEKAFQANAVAASASLTRTEQLLVVRNELKLQTAQVTAALKSENAALIEQRALASQSASAQAQLSGSIKLQEEAILKLLVEQRQLAIATAQNNVALKGYTSALAENTAVATTNVVAQTEVAVAETEVATASELSTGHMVRVGVAISHLDGLAIHGGRSIGHLAEAFSAMSLGQLALIAGAAILIGWIIQQIHAEEKLIEINEEGLKLDLARARTVEARQNLTKDLTALLLQYQAGVVALAAAQTEETAKFYEVAEAQKLANDRAAAGIELSGYTIIWQKLTHSSLEAVKSKYEELTNARMKDEVMVEKATKDLITFARETNKSSSEVLAAARSIGIEGQALAELTTQLTGAELAQRRLNAAIEAQKAPQVDFTKTREGILPLQESVKSGLAEAAAAGVKRYDDQVRANAKSLGELSSAVKNHTIVMSDLNAETQTAVKRHEQLTEAHHSGAGAARSHAAAERSLSNELVDLRKKAEDAEAALTLSDSNLQRKRIADQIQAEREHLAINKKDKTEALELLARIETALIAKVRKDELEKLHAALVQAEQERVAALQKEEQDLRTHLTRQRQIREEEERKFLADQAKLERVQRVDRPGRATAESEEIRKQADALKAVREAFGQTSVAGKAFDEMLRNIAQDGQAGFNGIRGSVAGLASELFSVANLANAVGNAIGNAFESAISGADSFGHSLTKAVLNFIGTIAQQFGAMFILIGSGLIWLGWPGGGALIAYGIALEALAGVLRGFASKVGHSAPAGGGAGLASGSAGATSGSVASARVVQPTLLNVPTSPKSSNDSWVDRAFAENRRRADQEAINRRNVLAADSGPITIELHLGADEALNLMMKGKGVIRLDNLGQNKQRIRRALGVQ